MDGMFAHLTASGRAELDVLSSTYTALAEIYKNDRAADDAGRWLLESIGRRMFQLMADPVTGTIILTPEWIEKNMEPTEPIVGEPSTWEDTLDDPFITEVGYE